MSFQRQPLLTLSPSPLPATPKLPRRERLAAVNRLLTGGHFATVLPGEYCEGGIRRKRLLRGEEEGMCGQSPVRLFVSECEDQPHEVGSRYQESNLLPFSPQLSNIHSPITLSPHYKHPTPTKSPLYTPDRKSDFLGRGSFGNVTLYQHKGTEFALKVIHESAQSRVGESNLLGVRHPHLVRVVHIAKVLSRFFICMEFAGRCNLQQILDTQSELDFHRRLSFCRQIASGLCHLHAQRIVHGDVKPANVVVSPYGVCKLGDFGHSATLDGTPPSPGAAAGTAAYAAPEVLMGTRVTLASDVYSFGITLWQVQSREMPYRGEHPHVVIYKVVHYGARPLFGKAENQVICTYTELTGRCWNGISGQRPTMAKILAQIQRMIEMS